MAPSSSRRFAGSTLASRLVTADAPIGVFDSGIGGLTVIRALRQRLPREPLLYFGDTARVPYGPKSPETVRRYALQIGEWLVEQGVKAVVVACNTATAHALDHLRAALPVEVIGVVEPGARAAVAATSGTLVPGREAAPDSTARDGGSTEGARSAPPDHNAIGVIGTAGTIASGAYERAIHALDPNAHVVARACPLFVPFVEEGWTEHAATRLVAEEYLGDMRGSDVRALVLGCTHYPLLTGIIGEIMGPGVNLIDSAFETARETERALDANGLLTTSDSPDASLRVVVSDAPQRFLPLANRFLAPDTLHDGARRGTAHGELRDIEQHLFP